MSSHCGVQRQSSSLLMKTKKKGTVEEGGRNFRLRQPSRRSAGARVSWFNTSQRETKGPDRSNDSKLLHAPNTRYKPHSVAQPKSKNKHNFTPPAPKTPSNQPTQKQRFLRRSSHSPHPPVSASPPPHSPPSPPPPYSHLSLSRTPQSHHSRWQKVV